MAVAYAWADRSLVCLRSQLPLVGEDAPTQWVDVAYEGEWHGHHSGSFELTREGFATLIANFERSPNPIKLDFDHETEFAPMGAATPARGWVHELEIRDAEDGAAHLWALVEFGPEAVRINRDGGYRFCSAVFDFGAVDRVTGEPAGLTLTSLALTDDPFLLGQEPIRLSRRAATGDNMDNQTEGTVTLSNQGELVSALLSALGVDEASLSDVDKVNPLGVVLREIEALKATPEIDVEVTDPESAPEQMAASADAPADLALMVSDALQAAVQALLDGGISEEELLAALEQLGADMASGEEQPEGDMAQPPALSALSARAKAQDETIKALQARLEPAEKQLREYREREADEAVGVLVESGRLLETGRETFRSLYLSNREQFDRMSAALPTVVPLGGHATGAEPPTQESPAIDEDDPRIAGLVRQLSSTPLSKAKRDAAIRRHLAALEKNVRV